MRVHMAALLAQVPEVAHRAPHGIAGGLGQASGQEPTQPCLMPLATQPGQRGLNVTHAGPPLPPGGSPWPSQQLRPPSAHNPYEWWHCEAYVTAR